MRDYKHRKNILAAVLLSAFFMFSFFSIGGEIVHRLTHHYENYAANDNCPASQLQAQALVLIVAFHFVLLPRISRQTIFTYWKFIFEILHFTCWKSTFGALYLPHLSQAPPFFVS
jgi:hypothetical protein